MLSAVGVATAVFAPATEALDVDGSSFAGATTARVPAFRAGQ